MIFIFRVGVVRRDDLNTLVKKFRRLIYYFFTERNSKLMYVYYNNALSNGLFVGASLQTFIVEMI